MLVSAACGRREAPRAYADMSCSCGGGLRPCSTEYHGRGGPVGVRVTATLESRAAAAVVATAAANGMGMDRLRARLAGALPPVVPYHPYPEPIHGPSPASGAAAGRLRLSRRALALLLCSGTNPCARPSVAEPEPIRAGRIVGDRGQLRPALSFVIAVAQQVADQIAGSRLSEATIAPRHLPSPAPGLAMHPYMASPLTCSPVVIRLLHRSASFGPGRCGPGSRS